VQKAHGPRAKLTGAVNSDEERFLATLTDAFAPQKIPGRAGAKGQEKVGLLRSK
jgi:hypothetical protein